MFETSDILDNSDNMVDYYELKDTLLYADFSRLDIKNKKMENAMIYLYNKSDKSSIEIDMLNKYNNYILKLVDNNKLNIMNNKYFRTIFRLEYQNNSDCVLGINMEDLTNILDDILDSIENKINNSIELSNLEKSFYQNSIIFFSCNSYIDSSDINTIVNYFNKCPVVDLKDADSRKLFLISMIARNIKDIGCRVCISFNKHLEISNGNVTFGHFGKLADGRYLLEVNNVNDYNIKDDKDFYKVIFVLLHELGHLNQDINYEKYSEDDKKRINIEKYLINNNKDFYDNNHDSFFVEIDANMYAVKRMLNEFSNKAALDLCKKKVDMLDKVYKDDAFIKLEYELYNAIYKISNK